MYSPRREICYLFKLSTQLLLPILVGTVATTKKKAVDFLSTRYKFNILKLLYKEMCHRLAEGLGHCPNSPDIENTRAARHMRGGFAKNAEFYFESQIAPYWKS